MMTNVASRIVFPEPRRIEVQDVEVDVDDLGPYDVVVKARRGAGPRAPAWPTVLSRVRDGGHNRGGG